MENIICKKKTKKRQVFSPTRHMYEIGQIAERGYHMNFLVLKKETILFIFAIGIALAAITGWFFLKGEDAAVINQQSNGDAREIDMITAEFKTNDGKAYRWDPGTVFLEKDENVKLYIKAVNGGDHPFYIEGTDIKGTINEGEEVVVPLQFDKEGTYRLICETHADRDHSVPMIAYIVVD
jgi:heme/copper-type cytochrome/quinol oxidase subunit 2